MVAPVIALAREVNPFRVSELVAHEAEVALSAQTERDEANHLVQGHSSEHPGCFLVEDTHIGVYFSIE